MRPTISLGQISIPEPCSADWDAMDGDQRTRFCVACGKHVHDLSARTRVEAERLLAATPDGLCVQMSIGPDGRVVTRERTPVRALSAVLAFALTLVGCRRADDAPTTLAGTPVQRTGGAVAPQRVTGDVVTVRPTTAPAAMVRGEVAIPPATRDNEP